MLVWFSCGHVVIISPRLLFDFRSWGDCWWFGVVIFELVWWSIGGLVVICDLGEWVVCWLSWVELLLAILGLGFVRVLLHGYHVIVLLWVGWLWVVYWGWDGWGWFVFNWLNCMVKLEWWTSCDREWLGRLKSPFDQFNNVSWDRLNHLSIILILEIKTNQCVFSKRSSMVVNAINLNCQFEGWT